MATIAVDTFLDGGVARTAGEAWTINSGARLTIRTDSRVHANAPASMTGSLGSVTINEGEVFIDATAVRWMPYNSGSGNVPAIGTTVSRGGASGHLLGVWASLTAAPTAVGAAMPASGFLKFREVTSGPFSAGALTGIGASATGPDVAGWLEIVHDESANITVGRLGKYKTRGAWFEVGQTNGSRAQVVQLPTNGGGANTFPIGAWVETAPGSNVYDKWPGMVAATGWGVVDLGAAEGSSDERHKFVKMVGGGQLQFGETTTFNSTYASAAAQASTYADWNLTGTYEVVDNVCTITFSGSHGLYGGEQAGLDFTSGGATDQIVTLTAIDAYRLTAPVTTANTSGNVTVRLGAVVSFTAHGLHEGFQVGLSVSTGTLPTGNYTIHSANSANNYNVIYPHTAALTSGNCSALHTLTITRTAHGLSTGKQVYLDFTSGAGIDGTFTILSTAANTYNVNFPHLSAIASSSVTERFDIGFVPPSGCKIRVPNIFFRACTTGARATNVVPNAILGTRPEFSTSTAGDMDFEYFNIENAYCNFVATYAFRAVHCAFLDLLTVTNSATAVLIDDVVTGQWQNMSTCLNLTSCTAGGLVKDSKFSFYTSSSNVHAVNLTSTIGITLENVEAIFPRYARGSANRAFNVSYSSSVTLDSCKATNGGTIAFSSKDVRFLNHSYADRLSGITNTTTALYAVNIEGGSSNVEVNGLTWDTNLNPWSGAVYAVQSSDIKVRNVGSPAAPLPLPTFAPNIYGGLVLLGSGGNNNGVKVQRCALQGVRGGSTSFALGSVNSDANVVAENIYLSEYSGHAIAAASSKYINFQMSAVNQSAKGVVAWPNPAGASAVYGSHWASLFAATSGQVVLAMNEPTVETAAYFSMVSGVSKYNSAGGIVMGVIGDQAVWETPYYILGHTGFENAAPVMTGGTIGHYTLEYQIDTGSGYGSWTMLNGTNLSGETISPATGFKLKLRITTTTTNTAAITYLRLFTVTNFAAQTENLYPTDVSTLTITGFQPGTDIVIYDATIPATGDGSNVLATGDAVTGLFNYVYEGTPQITIGAFKAGYVPQISPAITLGVGNSSFLVQQRADRNYQ